jgi:hypothetical protein
VIKSEMEANIRKQHNAASTAYIRGIVSARKGTDNRSDSQIQSDNRSVNNWIASFSNLKGI